MAGANGVSNYDRVTQGLKIVQGALGPFVRAQAVALDLRFKSHT